MVGAEAPADLSQTAFDPVQSFGAGRGTGDRPSLLRQPAPFLDRVDAHDDDSRGDKKLDGELADEPEADDAGRIAELRLATPNTLHGDSADGGERRLLGRDSLGHGNAEVGRDPVHLRVQRVVVAGASHELPDRELLCSRPDLGDHPAE
jgi:hypothetical protein